MQNRTRVKLMAAIAVVILALLPVQSIQAQNNQASSSMVFSPYTMYGLGDLIPNGTASSMAMGGIGVALNSPTEINYLNPASLGMIPQRTALFSFSARGYNSYSETSYTKTAYNNFDIADVGFAVPLYRGIGLGFSFQPVTAVGFNSVAVSEDPDLTSTIGRAKYTYFGRGGISQVNMALGFRVTRGLTLGLDTKYYFGNIERYYAAEIVPMLSSSTTYSRFDDMQKTHVSKILFALGGQYSLRVGASSVVTLGLTFQPGTKINSDYQDLKYITIGNVIDTVKSVNTKMPINLPAKYAAGLAYKSNKIVVGLDYTMQDWTNAYAIPAGQNIKLGLNQDIRFGFAFTPDMMSVTSALSRWTYKVGAHYTESYLIMDSQKLKDIGFSVGVDILMRRNNPSKMTVGLDFGKRGGAGALQVSEKYFKIYLGVNLFGGADWFYREKFE